MSNSNKVSITLCLVLSGVFLSFLVYLMIFAPKNGTVKPPTETNNQSIQVNSSKLEIVDENVDKNGVLCYTLKSSNALSCVKVQ